MADGFTLDKVYDPRAVEPDMYARWEVSGAFRSAPTDPPTPHEKTFTIVIPPPNVTGALHLGHALNNTLQDILVRYHRMRGFNTLWQPGTDHAGIATQAVVERRIREQEGKSRHELGREELVRRIWQWKDEYEKRIIGQLKLVGCSCDWGFKKVGEETGRDGKKHDRFECDGHRTRFTLDDGLAKAVRHMFFRLFRDGLIFRGKRLVNWDTQLQTAVADDEVYYETVKGAFYYFRYPVVPGQSRNRDEQSHEREGADRRTADVRSTGARPLLTEQWHTDGASEPRALARANAPEPEYVIIATTRPETMLGDVAVAVHPDPAGELDRRERELREQLANESRGSARAEIEAKLAAIAARRESHLPLLVTLSRMAREGRKLRLPLVDRVIPLIADDWADPMLGTGCVKITPAHDPNDYNVGLKHNLPMINVLTADGKIARIMEPDATAAPVKTGTTENAHSDRYAGLEFSEEGRRKVVADIEAAGLLEKVEDRDIEIGHSDRSKSPIEPYLSDQWFVRTADTENEKGKFKLASNAMAAAQDGRVRVFPERYAKSYLDWLGEKRDWCISRQLWWGHRIGVWLIRFSPGAIKISETKGSAAVGARCAELRRELQQLLNRHGRLFSAEGDFLVCEVPNEIPTKAYVCTRSDAADILLGRIAQSKPNYDADISETQFPEQRGVFFEEALINKFSGIFEGIQDPDVLDTWFSSALWPFSTLGWPEETPHLKNYYPGSVLVTSRDIITNWVARMVMFGLYALGDVPFDHVYIHPKILDGRGETMSKSKGNGVDPIDIIHTHGADALRYALADMCTETQDIRMPVEYVCPHCGGLVDQAIALKAEEQNRKSRGVKLDRRLQPSDCKVVRCTHEGCKKEFATQWADEASKKQYAVARETSDKFDIGRNFCNKLWNAARFAFMNIDGARCDRLDVAKLPPEDRWILARLSQTIRRFHGELQRYQFAAAVKELRDFFWDSLCDWYIELSKPRLSGGEANDPARQVLALCIDQVLRLWHPVIPFITERLWQQLGAIAPQRGLPGVAMPACDSDLITAEFPPVEGYPGLEDESILAVFALLQDATRGVRDLRNQAGVPPKDKVTVTVIVPCDSIESFRGQAHVVRHSANIGELHVGVDAKRPANAATMNVGGLRIYVHDISDDSADRTRTAKALDALSKQIDGKRSKLSNEKFVANAKPEVVEAERTRLAELEREESALREHLAELESSR